MEKLSTKEYKEKINVELNSKNKNENKFSNKFENKCEPEVLPEPCSASEFVIEVIKYTVIIFAITSLFTNFVMQRTTISG